MNKKNNEHNRVAVNQTEVLRKAMDALQALVPMEYALEQADDPYDRGYDFIVQAKIYGKEFVWCVEVRKRLAKAEEPQVLMKKGKMPHPHLLATGYVPFEAAARLREVGIQFIDTVGNAFIDQPPLLIFVKGNRPEKDEPAPTAARLFKGVGLKIVYLLLCRPELVDWPYRKIAEMTGVALGTVNGTMTEMIRRGFVLDLGKKGKRLLERKTLFERWVAAYPDYLKPKLLLGRFRGDGEWWKDARLDPALAQWGGEVAAAKLTGYLKPGTLTLYADRMRMAELVVANRLKKDPHGNVEILERFWPPENGFGEADVAHPVIIYADLAATGDQRTMETATLIYEQYLDRYFRQD